MQRSVESVAIIDSEIEVICESAFASTWMVAVIGFPSDSKLHRLNPFAFSDCEQVKSIHLPAFVDSISGRAFLGSSISQIQVAPDNRHFRVSRDFLLSFDGRSLVHYFGGDSVVQIDREIEVLSEHAFACRPKLSQIEFSGDSKLCRIEGYVFESCPSLLSICIPASVHTICPSAFEDSSVREVRISKGNRHFRVAGDFLLSFDGRSLIRCLSRQPIVRIDSTVEVVCKRAFSSIPHVSRVEFATDSTLRCIESFAFRGCLSLCSFFVPPSVEAIDGSAFIDSAIREIRVSEGNRHFRVSGSFLLSADGTCLIRYFGRDPDVTLGCEIQVLGHRSFASLPVRSLAFETGSRLRQIDSQVFTRSLLRVIVIPPFVESIDGSAFANSEISDIGIADGNRHFRVSGHFLMNLDGTSLIRYFGRDAVVKLDKEVEEICLGSFASCKLIQSFEFEASSKLRCIGARAFEKCRMLSSISLPQSTELLCRSCFRKCTALLKVEFRTGAKLRRIESSSFGGCQPLLSVSIPKSLRESDGVDLTGATGVDIVWSD
jgi:hypothetical protein